VSIDQAWHNDSIAEIDHAGIGRHRIADGFNSAALDDEHLVRLVTSRMDVEDPRGADCD